MDFDKDVVIFQEKTTKKMKDLLNPAVVKKKREITIQELQDMYAKQSIYSLFFLLIFLFLSPLLAGISGLVLLGLSIFIIIRLVSMLIIFPMFWAVSMIEPDSVNEDLKYPDEEDPLKM